MVQDFQVYSQPVENLQTFEQTDYQNIRNTQGEILPLFRVIDKDRAKQDNQNPEKTFAYQKSRRRTPRSAPPIVDLLLETHRMLCFPDLPSRQHSHFANLHGYLSTYLQGKDKAIYLVLPHKNAQVGISSIRDFKIPDVSSIVDALQKYITPDTPESTSFYSLLQKKETYDKPDYIFSHQFLNLLSCFKSWIDDPSQSPALVQEILNYWPNMTRPRDLTDVSQIGPEALIEGKAYFVEIPSKHFKKI